MKQELNLDKNELRILIALMRPKKKKKKSAKKPRLMSFRAEGVTEKKNFPIII